MYEKSNTIVQASVKGYELLKCPDTVTCTNIEKQLISGVCISTLLPPCTHYPGDKAEALDMYSRGVTELEKGINMHITAEGTSTFLMQFINCNL